MTAPTLVLALVDWTVDPADVVTALRRHRLLQGACSYALVVPAWLHGLDWAGDPAVRRPCAEREAGELATLCAAAGLPVTSVTVGDPDPATAAGDALADAPAEQVLVLTRAPHWPFGLPFDLPHRLGHATGLPVRRLALGVRAPASAARPTPTTGLARTRTPA